MRQFCLTIMYVTWPVTMVLEENPISSYVEVMWVNNLFNIPHKFIQSSLSLHSVFKRYVSSNINVEGLQMTVVVIHVISSVYTCRIWLLLTLLQKRVLSSHLKPEISVSSTSSPERRNRRVSPTNDNTSKLSVWLPSNLRGHNPFTPAMSILACSCIPAKAKWAH